MRVLDNFLCSQIVIECQAAQPLFAIQSKDIARYHFAVEIGTCLTK